MIQPLLILSLDKNIDLLNDTLTPLLLISFLRCTSIDQLQWEEKRSLSFYHLRPTFIADSEQWRIDPSGHLYSGMSKQSVNIGKGGKIWKMCNWKIDRLDLFRCSGPPIHCIGSSVIEQAFRCSKVQLQISKRCKSLIALSMAQVQAFISQECLPERCHIQQRSFWHHWGKWVLLWTQPSPCTSRLWQ